MLRPIRDDFAYFNSPGASETWLNSKDFSTSVEISIFLGDSFLKLRCGDSPFIPALTARKRLGALAGRRGANEDYILGC